MQRPAARREGRGRAAVPRARRAGDGAGRRRHRRRDVARIVEALGDRIKVFGDILLQAAFFFGEEVTFDDKAFAKRVLAPRRRRAPGRLPRLARRRGRPSTPPTLEQDTQAWLAERGPGPGRHRPRRARRGHRHRRRPGPVRLPVAARARTCACAASTGAWPRPAPPEPALPESERAIRSPMPGNTIRAGQPGGFAWRLPDQRPMSPLDRRRYRCSSCSPPSRRRPRSRRAGERYKLGDLVSGLGCGTLDQIVNLVGGRRVHRPLRDPGVGTRRSLDLPSELAGSPGCRRSCCTIWPYYLFHRASHRVNVLWAAHAVHHQSEDYTFAVSLAAGGDRHLDRATPSTCRWRSSASPSSCS